MTSETNRRTGILMGVAAYGMWGLLPLFIKLLRPLPAPDILAQRVLWSLLLLGLLVMVTRRLGVLATVFRSGRLVAILTASCTLIAVNWLLYIHAVNSGHVLQASLGYFINPLVNVALGVVILKERLGRVEVVAVVLATLGVAALTIAQHALPLISLSLAFSFGLYGLVRKVAPVGPLEGLMVETALLAPLAALWLGFSGAETVVGGPSIWLLAASGVVTAVPLLLFAGAAKRMRYADLGLLQYLAPSLQLLLAVAVFGEPLLPIHMLTFALIWTGLALYAGATWRRGRTDVVPIIE